MDSWKIITIVSMINDPYLEIFTFIQQTECERYLQSTHLNTFALSISSIGRRLNQYKQ